MLFLVRELIELKARDIDHVAAHWKSALNAFVLFFEGRGAQWNRVFTQDRLHGRPGPETWEQRVGASYGCVTQARGARVRSGRPLGRRRGSRQSPRRVG